MLATYKAWMGKDPFRLSAAVAYYAVLSLPALLVIIVNAVGMIWGEEIVAGRLATEFDAALGKDAADSIKTMIDGTRSDNRNILSTIVGIGTLIYGATGLFYQLQLALNDIWGVKPDPEAKWWKVVLDRARSFTFILVIGFLLLISFILTAGISALRDLIGESFSESVIPLTYLLDITASLGIISVLFALIYKYLPDADVKWSTVRLGGFVTAVLFIIGKYLLSYYFGKSDPGSTYGAAGSIVLILLWVSYSCLILFFGAEFTYVYAGRYGQGIKTETFAKKKSD